MSGGFLGDVREQPGSVRCFTDGAVFSAGTSLSAAVTTASRLQINIVERDSPQVSAPDDVHQLRIHVGHGR